MTARNFKKLTMKMQTEKGDKIRDYYIDLEELFKNYIKYQVISERMEKMKIEKKLKKSKDKIKSKKNKIKSKDKKIKMKDNKINKLNNTIEEMREEMRKHNMKMEKHNIEMSKKTNEIINKNDILINENKKTNKNLEKLISHIPVKPKNKEKENIFMIIKLNDKENKNNYYMIRRQVRTIRKALNEINERHPKCEAIFKIEDEANAIQFGGSFVEYLKNKCKKKININNNYIMIKKKYDKKIIEYAERVAKKIRKIGAKEIIKEE
jgi:hypothetical protein